MNDSDDCQPRDRLRPFLGKVDSDEGLGLAFGESSSGILVSGGDGRLLRGNPALCHLLGYSESDLRQLNILDITHPEDHAKVAEQLQDEAQAFQGQESVKRRFLRKDGQVVWTEVTTSTMRETDAGSLRIFAIVEDVGARVRHEESQRRKKQYLERLGDAAPVIILVVDTAGRIVQFNRFMETLSGFALDEVRGLDWFELFVPPESRKGLMSSMHERNPDLQHLSSAYHIVTKSGVQRLIQWSAEVLREPDGSIGGILSIGIDITEQRRLEQEASIEKERSRAIFAAAHEGIITLDQDGCIESVNPSAERMFGYRQQEILGRDVFELITPTIKKDARKARVNAVEEGSRLRKLRNSLGAGRDMTAAHSSGRTFPIHFSLSEMHVGHSRGFCGFIRNLSESRRVEEQLRQSQKMEALGLLASGVAHDFNNLLMGVSGCASVALECVDSGRSDRMYLSEIKKAAESGTAMTQQLLAFSRKAEVELDIFEFDKVVRDQEALLRRLLGEDIEIQLSLGAGRSRVQADVGQINQVLMNLAVNARDAMPTGGRLRIESHTVSLPVDNRWKIGPNEAVPAGPYVQLSVEDTGVGMPAETCERLFEPFFTTKASGRGTGLGLATVYGIVKQSGGHIDVRSAEHEGSRFEILLPLVEYEVPRVEPVVEVASDQPGHGTILLCEDDRLVCLTIRYYLEGAGYRVLRAQSGTDAIECCKQHPEPFDLLLTDVVLPDLSGERIAREVRELKPGIKVLYMSAHTAEWLKGEGRTDAELETLQKPFDGVFLLRRIAQILRPKPDVSMLVAEEPQAPAETLGTVMLVDDDDHVRRALRWSLESRGYQVLAARDGQEAVDLARGHEGALDALVVDVVLPKIMGIAVAHEVQMIFPEIRVIYMSGYPREVAIQTEIVGAVLFAQKPVAADRLHELIQGRQGGATRRAQVHADIDRGAILVVEDMASARLAIADYLQGEGWRVATAGNGGDALALMAAGGCHYDVLLVDYSLPDMKGDALAAHAQAIRPDIAVAYMSGYSTLRLDPPGPLLTKPLDLVALSATVASLLGAQPLSQSATRPGAQSATQPGAQSATQPGAQSATQPGAQSATQPALAEGQIDS